MLKSDRGICFDDIEIALSDQSRLLDIINNPNQEKYPDQHIFIIELFGYAHMVPFAETEKEIFLKTVIPSRKMTKRYLGVNDVKPKLYE